MANKNDLYRCAHCDIIVEVFHAGKGKMMCCGQAMDLLEENTTEAAVEKHVPVIEKTADGYKISVGSVEHPMTEEHYIEWIEVLNGDRKRVFHLNPTDKPVVEVKCDKDCSSIVARAYCNLHGHWKNA